MPKCSYCEKAINQRSVRACGWIGERWLVACWKCASFLEHGLLPEEIHLPKPMIIVVTTAKGQRTLAEWLNPSKEECS